MRTLLTGDLHSIVFFTQSLGVSPAGGVWEVRSQSVSGSDKLTCFFGPGDQKCELHFRININRHLLASQLGTWRAPTLRSFKLELAPCSIPVALLGNRRGRAGLGSGLDRRKRRSVPKRTRRGRRFASLGASTSHVWTRARAHARRARSLAGLASRYRRGTT